MDACRVVSGHLCLSPLSSGAPEGVELSPGTAWRWPNSLYGKAWELISLGLESIFLGGRFGL